MNEQMIVILAAQRSVENAQTVLNKIVRKARVRIVTDWNNQPYGRSHPSMHGREFVVKLVILAPEGNEPSLWLAKPDTPEEYFGACALSDVEFI